MFSSFNARAIGLKLPLLETLEIAHEAGFGGVDVMIQDALEEGADLREARRRMDGLGLKAGAFPFPFDWRGEKSAYESGLKRLGAIAEAAATLGLIRTGTWVMLEAVVEAAHEDACDATFNLHVVRLGAIAGILAEYGIRLGLEAIGVESSRTGRAHPFIHRLDQLEGLRATVESGSAAPVGVILDSWHLYAANEPLAHALQWRGDRIVSVHVADLPAGAPTERSAMIDHERGLPGEHGAIDSKAMLSALKAHGYDGPITAEPMASCRSLSGLSPRAAAKKTAESLRSIWPL